MAQLTVPIIRQSDFPAGYCYPSTPQALFEAIVDRIVGVFTNNMSGIIISDTPPGADDRDKLWFNTNNSDSQIYRWETSIGTWARKHPFDPSSEKRVWFPLETDLTSEDGGNANPVGDADGPFWARDTAMDGRFPLAKGTIPGTSPAVTVADGASSDSNGKSGEYQHSLAETEMPPHTHTFHVVANNAASSGSGELTGGEYNSPNDGHYDGITGNAGGVSDGATPPVYTVAAHNNMPPYLVGIWAKRTARIWILPL